jgi:hypothetical protein
MLKRIIDLMAFFAITLAAPLFRAVGKWPGNFPIYLRQADRLGFHLRSTHYYHPTYRDQDLPRDVTRKRILPGLDLNESGQLDLLKSFQLSTELAVLADNNEVGFTYDNDQYGHGDADSLYAMVRHKKPKRVFEIGSGNSTRIVQLALRANQREDSTYKCLHRCVEPYEMPWLESLGPEIIRKKVEDVPLAMFRELDAGDILFIDSSHVIRPFGDVLVEFQEIIPRLAKGVLVHIHDIFTPFDYPEKWLRRERRLWNEQYLLEVMLAHSDRYRTLLAMNWLSREHPIELSKAFPILANFPECEPGAFWFEVIA